MAATSNMFFYSLTVAPPSAVTTSIVGQFIGGKEQQVLTAHGSTLSLYRPLAEQGKLEKVLSHDTFSIVRKLAAFRLAGMSKDSIIVTSDSGRITIIEYMPEKNRFERVHLETFGKSGVRRVVPGEYLATDPKGRACMLASLEKNKLVYILNRNAQAKLTISSPLEAHKANTMVFDLVALDVHYDNPIFASLELEFNDENRLKAEDFPKELVYYELDLGLNHVVRKWSDVVDRTACKLFHVPGGKDGPSGVLVCGEESITYRHSNQGAFRVAIPRRQGATEDPNRKRYIVAGLMHKLKNDFFFLLQSEDGDLLKVQLEMAHDEEGRPTVEVARLTIKYFDTVPVATNICILKAGFLYVACESGDHHLYQFEGLGDNEGEMEWDSDSFPENYLQPYKPVYFHPRLPVNITLVESIPLLNPIMASKVLNLTDEDSPQIYSACGAGPRSSFRTSKHALTVSEIAESPLPGSPNAVWTVKKTSEDEFDSHIVLSFNNHTLVLKIDESVEEDTDTGLISSTSTLAVQQIGEDSLIQVHPRGIRQIFGTGNVLDWQAPQHRTIVAATANTRQVAIALSSGELIYFELDPAEQTLSEYEGRSELAATITCMSLGEVPHGRARSPFLAIGCDDSTVRILSTDPDQGLENKSVQALSASPVAMSIMSMPDSSSGGSTMFLHIGLYSGLYLRTVLDEYTGDLSDTRSRFLGPSPARLFPVSVKGEPAMLALSSRPWLGYAHSETKTFMLTPLDYGRMDWGWSFKSEQIPEGMVGIFGEALRIFYIEDTKENLLTTSIPLSNTPRDFVRHHEKPLFYAIESDYNTLAPDMRQRLIDEAHSTVNGDSNGTLNGDSTILPPADFGYPRGQGHWASCIQVIDPIEDKKAITCVDLEENEAAVSVAVVPFDSQDGRTFLVVGTSKDQAYFPRYSHNGGFIHVYDISEDGLSLELIHKTQVADPPMALLAFQGRLLAGVGKQLLLYDLGLKQLLRKARNDIKDSMPTNIVGLQSQGSRIVVSDSIQSVTYFVSKYQDNKLIPFVDDSIERHTTCTTMVDYETVAGGDKFGNVWLVRCPPKASEQADEEGSTHLTHERAYLGATPNRLDLLAHFYTQDLPKSIQKTSLVPGGSEVLFWAGMQGTLGVFVPFVGREDVDFFQNLQNAIIKEDEPITGRDHLAYRGYYVPVKGVIDGDLCERFLMLDRSTKMKVASGLDRDIREIERKISDMRTRLAF